MRVRDGSGLTRRELLGAGAALAAAAAVAPLARGALAAPAPVSPFLAGAPKTKRVVLVVFGGGVRSRETVRSDNTPNLRALADEGVLYPQACVENVGHYGAAVSRS
jgi:hypothetical protein